MRCFSKDSVKKPFVIFPNIFTSQTECSSIDFVVWRFFVKVSIQNFDLISLLSTTKISSTTPPQNLIPLLGGTPRRGGGLLATGTKSLKTSEPSSTGSKSLKLKKNISQEWADNTIPPSYTINLKKNEKKAESFSKKCLKQCVSTPTSSKNIL